MNGTLELRGTLFGLALLLAACSSPSGPSEQAQAPAPEAKPEAAAPAPLEQAPAAEEPAVVEATPAAAAPSQETAPAAAPAPAAQTTAAPAPAPAKGPAPTAPVTTPAPAAAPAAASPLIDVDLVRQVDERVSVREPVDVFAAKRYGGNRRCPVERGELQMRAHLADLGPPVHEHAA